MTERVHKPSFIKNNDADLFQELRKQVNETVDKLEPQRRNDIILKAILFPALYILFYCTALIWSANETIYQFAFFMMGILLVLNFLNLIHEAVHNTLFRNKRINNWYVHFFDLMGANSYIWKIRHIRLHHNYPT